MPKILVVDDDEIHLLTLAEWLRDAQHLVDTASNGKEGLEFLAAFSYDLVIVDWQMPVVSGVELVKQFRKNGGQTPIIMLTGKDAENDKAQGLDAGADDYLSKPFGLIELGARLRAQLRRSSTALIPETIQFRDITVETGARRVLKGGQVLALQPLEFALLEFLAKNQNQVFSAEDLIRRVWDSDNAVSHDALYGSIKRLRKKLDTDSSQPSIIQNLHGVGYRFVP